MMKWNRLVLFVLLLASCGYQEIEEDKYPDIPEFPETSHSKILISPFHSGHLKSDPIVLKDYLILWKSEPSKGSELLVYNKNLELIRTYPGTNIQRIFSRKDFINTIEIEYRNDNSEQYRQIVTIPEMKIETPKTTHYSPDYSYFFGQQTYPNFDATQFTAKQKQQLLNRFEDSIISLHLDSIISFSDHGEVTFTDKTSRFYHVFESNNLLIDRIDSNKYLPVLEAAIRYKKDGIISKYDHAVLGNRSSGNHLVFGYHPFGYVYYDINYHGEKAQTKHKNGLSLEAKHFTIKLFDQEMIYAPNPGKLYKIELK